MSPPYEYSMDNVGSFRWMAPEQLSVSGEDSEPTHNTIGKTKESDMYSLAMVVLEVRSLSRWLTLYLTQRFKPPD